MQFDVGSVYVITKVSFSLLDKHYPTACLLHF